MGGQPPRRSYGFRAFAIGITCSLAFGAVTHLYLFDASEDAVSRSMRYDLAWTGANGRLEFANLEKQVARLNAHSTKDEADAARLFYEIVRGRMNTWGSGRFRQFIEASPRRLAQYEMLRAGVEGLKGDMERLGEPDARQRLLKVMEAIGPTVERIGAEAHTTTVAESATVKEDLLHHQQLQRWLVWAMLASGAAVLVFTARQNRSLRAAHVAAARHAEDSLFLAQHDALTKLPNRTAFQAAYQAALQAKRQDERIQIAAIDLDGFKSINDLLGHGAGDAALVAFAQILTREATRGDLRNIVCRFGGDEFLALLWTSAQEAPAMAFARAVLAAVEHPLETSYGAIMIGASVGIATSDAAPGSDLIVNADLALAEAKTRGKGIALAFDPSMLAGLKRRLRLEADLGPAVSKGEFALHYQPKVDLASGGLVGFEALARWHHPELGPVSPAEFIPVAESSGAIVKIGRLVLDTACRDAATVIPRHLSIAVNISVVQILNDDITGAVKEALASSSLEPARLTLEITESVMMTDPENVLDALNQLKALGVRISLDDFGTGYSALAYLTQFSWDELKIDRSFIGRAASNPINLAIIKAVKMLALQMHAKLTVEGVENREQCEMLRAIGCDTAQGYLFGRPAPIGEFQPMLLRSLAEQRVESDAAAPAATEEPLPAISGNAPVKAKLV